MGLKRHCYLCGFMGSGKTTVGAVLAERLGCHFFDTDDQIVTMTGRSIPDIFATDGEPAFRTLESEALRSVAERSPAVISTGGGLVTIPENVTLLGQTGQLVFLDTPFALCYERIRTDANRPNAASRTEEELRALYEQRAKRYRAVTDVVVKVTQADTPLMLTKQIVEMLA